MASKTAVAAALLTLASRVFARPGLTARGSDPIFDVDPTTVKSCDWWYDHDGSFTCEEIPDNFFITAEQFLFWNPSVGAGCKNFPVAKSYCVESKEAPAVSSTKGASTPAPQPTTSSVPPTKPSTSTPKPTPTGNGIETPLPTQPGMVNNCNKFYQVIDGDTCEIVLNKNKLTLADFYKWNSGVGDKCQNMWLDTWYCVSVIGWVAPTSTPVKTTAAPTPTNGITTPLPTQSGMVNNCNKFYKIVDGDTCQAVLDRNKLTLAEFYKWNAGVGDKCQNMWLDTWYCISVIGWTPATTTKPPTTPTPTKGTNGITTPTPTQPGMVSNCDKFYKVPAGEPCATVVSKNGITLAEFTKWNTGVGNNCQSMWGDTWHCVRIIGWKPPATSTTKGNGVATPTPIQTGMVTNCKTFEYVDEGETCDDIVKKYKITLANFVKWNPAVKSDCKGMWAKTWACVALI